MESFLEEMLLIYPVLGLTAFEKPRVDRAPVQDYSFDSPSTASSVLLGRNSNGRVDWKDKEGRTLKDIQTAAVEEPGG